MTSQEANLEKAMRAPQYLIPLDAQEETQKMKKQKTKQHTFRNVLQCLHVAKPYLFNPRL